MDGGGAMAKGVGEPFRWDVSRASGGVKGVEGRGVRSVVFAEAKGDAAEGLAGTEERVRVGTVCDAFAADACFLVREREGGVRHAQNRFVIQKRGRSWENFAVQRELDVAEAEGLGPCSTSAEGVLGRSEEPEEAQYEEIEDEGVGGTFGLVLDVELTFGRLEDGNVCWVSA